MSVFNLLQQSDVVMTLCVMITPTVRRDFTNNSLTIISTHQHVLTLNQTPIPVVLQQCCNDITTFEY